jgi:hypothetical protein
MGVLPLLQTWDINREAPAQLRGPLHLILAGNALHACDDVAGAPRSTCCACKAPSPPSKALSLLVLQCQTCMQFSDRKFECPVISKQGMYGNIHAQFQTAKNT